MKSAILALLAMVAGGCCGAVSVTASRDYVDKKTTLHPVEEGGTTNVVGYFLGTQTNKVLISEYGISKSTPGDYYNVSNAAMNARSKTDMNVYTNSTSAGEEPLATGDRLATTGEVAIAMSAIKSDLITDGTNTIDAAGNYYDLYPDSWISIDDGNIFTNVGYTTAWYSIITIQGDEVKGYIIYDPEENAWICNPSSSYETPSETYYDIPVTATNLAGGAYVRGDHKVFVGKLALTNDVYSTFSLARSKTDMNVYSSETTPWSCTELHASGEYAAMTNLLLWGFTTNDGVGVKYPEIWYNGTYIGNCNSPMADEELQAATEWSMFYDYDLYMTFRRQLAGQPTGDRLAMTSDIPSVVSADLTPATNYTDQVGARVAGDATNYTDAVMAEFGRTNAVSSITDGTNTIDAARNVWEMYEGNTNASSWSYNINPEGVNIFNYGLYIYWNDGTTEDSVIGWKIDNGDYHLGTDTALSRVEYVGEYWDEASQSAKEVQVVATRNIPVGLVYVGKLALTNDINYTTSNTQLVATIEAKAPAPGNYPAVSNAAMNARGATDLGVRGAPQGEGSWFMVNGQILAWDAEFEAWGDANLLIDDFRGHYYFFGPEGEEEFQLDENFSHVITFGTNTCVIIGYTNTLAQVSQIPAISATDPTFSNAVLSVGLGIDTNAVAAINALVEQGKELPIGGATTVGALLLALAAAIAALKRNKADKVSGATAGNLASLTAQGDIADSGMKPSDFAAKADLPYAMVTPGEWEFSDGGTYTIAGPMEQSAGVWAYLLDADYVSNHFTSEANALAALELVFDNGITATRPSLPGHLCDRAVNAVSVSDTTMLTLPALVNAGKSRDFYVRLSVSAESAVTFAATDSGGDAVAWDSMGDPSATLAIGTYLYRFTEVAPGVFHAADITDGGSIDPAVLDGKLEATSAAPAFSASLTYLVGEYVTYGGVLYRCNTAVTTAGAWTGTSNWEADDMTSPDATLDIMSDGRLRVVTVAGEDLWMQGYDLESTSAQVLKCDKVNLLKFSATTAEAFDSTVAYAVGDSVVYGGMVYKFTAAHSAGAWIGTDAAVDSASLTMPYVPVGKVGDFVLDVDNSANASVKMTAELSGLFTAFDVFVDKGRNLSDLLTFDGGEQCELYFTMTAFGTQAKPAWKVVKQVVEKQEAGS